MKRNEFLNLNAFFKSVRERMVAEEKEALEAEGLEWVDLWEENIPLVKEFTEMYSFRDKFSGGFAAHFKGEDVVAGNLTLEPAEKGLLLKEIYLEVKYNPPYFFEQYRKYCIKKRRFEIK